MKESPTAEIAALLRSHPPAVHDLVAALRRLVAAAVPTAEERVRTGWHSISYAHPRQGYFAGLFPRDDAVQLVFEFGILLPDPDRLLEGDGRQVRFLTLRQVDAIPVAALKDLIEAALSLPEKRPEKLAMIASGARPTRDG